MNIWKRTLSPRITFHVALHLVIKTRAIYVWVGLFAVILFILQWLFNINQLFEVVLGSNPLSIGERIDYLIDGFFNIFRFADDFVPIAMILIAAMQSLTLTLLIWYRGRKRIHAQQGLALGLSFIGVGCVACGGSILTPLLGVMAANVSVGLAEGLSDLLLLIGLVLSYTSMNHLAFQVAQAVAKK